MPAESREERRLMRMRGAGIKELQNPHFSFVFGSSSAKASPSIDGRATPTTQAEPVQPRENLQVKHANRLEKSSSLEIESPPKRKRAVSKCVKAPRKTCKQPAETSLRRTVAVEEEDDINEAPEQNVDSETHTELKQKATKQRKTVRKQPKRPQVSRAARKGAALVSPNLAKSPINTESANMPVMEKTTQVDLENENAVSEKKPGPPAKGRRHAKSASSKFKAVKSAVEPLDAQSTTEHLQQTSGAVTETCGETVCPSVANREPMTNPTADMPDPSQPPKRRGKKERLPSDVQLCRALQQAVRDCFARDDLEALTVMRIRTAVEVEQQLPPGFFKTHDTWKMKSKTVITEEVERLQNLDEPVEEQKSLSPLTKDEHAPAIQPVKSVRVPHTAPKTKAKAPVKPAAELVGRKPRTALSQHSGNTSAPVKEARKPSKSAIRKNTTPAYLDDENDDSSVLESNGFLDHFPVPIVPASLALGSMNHDSTKLKFRL